MEEARATVAIVVLTPELSSLVTRVMMFVLHRGVSITNIQLKNHCWNKIVLQLIRFKPGVERISRVLDVYPEQFVTWRDK